MYIDYYFFRFFVYNLYRQNDQLEEYIREVDKKEKQIYDDAEKYYLAFVHLFQNAQSEMDRIDKKGSFSSDDEVGFAFKVIHSSLNTVVSKLQEIKDEQQSKDSKVEFLVYGHDKKGKGKIVSVMAENSKEAINIAIEENKDCKFNHANIK